MWLVVCLSIGFVAGLRAMTAPAAVAWAAWSGHLSIGAGALAWLGHPVTVGVLTVLAIGELVSDQLPKTPSRKVPVQFATRVAAGALCGAAVAGTGMALWIGTLAGAVGAVLGTLLGAAGRARLAAAFGRDLPAALVEDAIAIALAAVTVLASR